MRTPALYKKSYVHVLAMVVVGVVALVVYTWYPSNLFQGYRYDGSRPTGDGRLIYQIRTVEDAYPWYGYTSFERLFVSVHLGLVPDGDPVVVPNEPGVLGMLTISDPTIWEHVLLPIGRESPAYKQGIRAGDTLLSINGESVRGVSADEVFRRMDERPFSMTVRSRSGRERTVTFTEPEDPDGEGIDLGDGVAHVYTPTLLGYVFVFTFWIVFALFLYYTAIALVSIMRKMRWWWKIPLFIICYTVLAVALGIGVSFIPGVQTIVGFADAVERRT